MSHSLQIIEADNSNNPLAVKLVGEFYDCMLYPEFIKKCNFQDFHDVPVVEVGLIHELLSGAGKIISHGETTYVADMDSLPIDIKRKLADSVYTIADSKQVIGNARAVILDENGVRIRDITMKKVTDNSALTDVVRNIGIQLQLKRIADKMIEIIDLQDYLVQRNRDTTVYCHFLSARDLILCAQTSDDDNATVTKLRKAADKLLEGMNSVYTDLDTSSNKLAEIIKRPVFQNTKKKNQFIRFIAEDFFIINKYVPIYLAVLSYILDYSTLRLVEERYKNFMDKFFAQKINGKTVAQMLQEHYPYDDTNRNYWRTVICSYKGIETKKIPKNIVVMTIEGE